MNQNFFKKHSFFNYNNNNIKIKKIFQGLFAVYFIEGGLLNYSELKAIIFFLKKRLKFLSKLYIRFQPNFKNTSKPIGVRMGKGKGSLDSNYYVFSKGQIFVEFGFKKKKILSLNVIDKNKLFSYINKIINLASLKSKVKFKILHNNKK